MLTRIIDEYGVVCKINVADINASIQWYGKTLGLINDEKFFEPGVWAQLNCPGIKSFALGLSAHDRPIGQHGSTITFMVSDIALAKSVLDEKGILTSEIVDAGKGVLLAKFMDLDGNELVLRQNKAEDGHQIGDQD
ncbi:MAG: VOC family protein [Fibrobacterales bacterium]